MMTLTALPVLLQAQTPLVGKVQTRGDASFYENKTTISLESANLFDIGSESNYHLAPQIVSFHWQLDDVGNPGWRRGNTEWVVGAYYTPVINGPEHRFTGGLFGPRYNFVQPGSKWVPYVDARVGFAFTNSVNNDMFPGAQGQDFCFTFAVGVGTRYVIDDRWDVSVGALYQHISNGGLSEPGQVNNGLDSVGPNVAVNYKF